MRNEQIVKGKDGSNWIKMKRQKTDKSISVPILPVAQKILNKYNGQLTHGKYLLSKTNTNHHKSESTIACQGLFPYLAVLKQNVDHAEIIEYKIGEICSFPSGYKHSSGSVPEDEYCAPKD